MGTDTVPDDRAGCERVFRRNGLPLLIEGHTVGRDVFGRAAPFLVLLMLASTVGAVDLSWPVWVNVLAVTGAAVAVCAAFAGVNVLRRRPWNTLPQEVGAAELVVFVLVPAAVSLLIGNHWEPAAVIVTVNLLVLVTLRYLVGYGVLATVWWGLARIVDELAASLLRLIRLLPLLMLFSVVLFYASEIWQVFDQTATVANVLLGAFFTVVILVLVLLRVPTEAGSALRDAARAVPGGETATDLTRTQRTNLYAMIGVSQLLQVLVVSAAMGVFFVAMGTLTVTADTMQRWDVTGGTWRHEVAIGDARLLMSATLIRVAVAIATFTGLYYAISVQVDPAYRTEFVGGVGSQLRQVLAVRVRYREILGAEAARRVTTEAPPPA